jgi:hypothetical protein
VLYPCNKGSSPGFLEHLPSLFKETHVKPRYALRYAVLAFTYANSIDGLCDQVSKEKAFHYYGLALSALADSLKEVMLEPDDYVLMTIVVLDLFEVSCGLHYSDFSER